MEKKFKVGDFARKTLGGEIVKIEVIKDDWIAYREARVMTGACPMEEVEPVDNKTAFLSDLADVLRKHNAEIYPSSDGWDGEVALAFMLGGKEEINYPDDILRKIGYSITPDNIMDYDKE